MRALALIVGLLTLGCTAATDEVRVTPKGSEDMTTAVLSAVRQVHNAGGGQVRLASGDYHFYASSAKRMKFHVSNHDQPAERPVFLPLIGVTNVTIKAKNARFVMHGMGTAVLLDHTKNIAFKGITIEWEKPFFAQAEIVGFDAGVATKIKFADRDTVVLDKDVMRLVGEDWRANLRWGNIFDKKTHEILADTGDVGVPRVCGKKGRVFSIAEDLSRRGAKVGDVFIMRDYARPHPIVCLNEAVNTAFEDFTFRDGFGMGILAQMSKNLHCRRVACTPRGENEYCSNTIDAIHCSNVSGKVIVEESVFEGMMDDALNVHSTSLAIVAKPAANTIRCRFMHAQAYGLNLFNAGEHIRFIAGKTLENGPTSEIAAVKVLSEREVELTLATPIPSAYEVGDAIENADRQCAVVFRKNRVADNRARGVLFTTPKKVVCEDNIFDHVSGSAILLAGDAMGWYESGACEDVEIRGNRFIDCLTSRYQYCNGIVSIYPEIKNIAAQKKRYHRNITIENNEIETSDVPLLYAVSAEDVHWVNNRVIRNERYRSWRKPAFDVRDCGKLDLR